MNAAQPRTIVIAGKGAAAWLTASALLRILDPGSNSVTVVESGDEPSDQPFVLGDGALPEPAGVHGMLFPSEAELVARWGAAWTFGIALSGWSKPDATYFHPFGRIGAEFGPIAFHQVVQRLRQDGVPARLANFSLSAIAAQAGRFRIPPDDPRSVLSTCRHGLHLDLGQLTHRARSEAERAGACIADGFLADAVLDENGHIRALRTMSGAQIEGDLFIDCSGTSAQLIGRLTGSRWEDWSNWLPCNRVASAAAETREAPLPYSHAEATESGWTQYLPMQNETILNGVFDSSRSDDEREFERFREFAGAGTLTRFTAADVRFGRRHFAWNRNCVALGAAAVLIDPIGVSNLHLLRSGIRRLCTLLPGGADTEVMAAEFNRQSAAEISHARDFALLHYRLNGREGEPLWDAARKMAIPASLGYRLQLYANLGRVAMYDFEPLEDISWINLFDEHGVQPRQLHPVAAGVGIEELKAHAERVRSVMMMAVQEMPLHADYLSRVRAEYEEGN